MYSFSFCRHKLSLLKYLNALNILKVKKISYTIKIKNYKLHILKDT